MIAKLVAAFRRMRTHRLNRRIAEIERRRHAEIVLHVNSMAQLRYAIKRLEARLDQIDRCL
ncbi:hypothetical protein ACFX58_03585 [Sphingomonas sp. NCPPB 2930]